MNDRGGGDDDDSLPSPRLGPTSDPDPSKTSYESAVRALLRDHQATTAAEIRAAGARRKRTGSDLREYWNRIVNNGNGNGGSNGESGGNGNELHVHPPAVIVHIAGTKGKGSTACLCEAVLRNSSGFSQQADDRRKTTTTAIKTGLFTSPHLVCPRERIRIDGRPVDRVTFARAYWQVRTALEEHDSRTNRSNDDDRAANDAANDLPVLPGYFRMLTLVAVVIFGQYHRVDALVLEVGMGGRHDATNFVTDLFADSGGGGDGDGTKGKGSRVVCGIALLDYDHTRVLGDTLELIAGEKAGIFKPNTTVRTLYALDSPTYDGTAVRQVLSDCVREAERGDGNGSSTIHWIPPPPPARSQQEQQEEDEPHSSTHRWMLPHDAALGIPGRHQRWNAELALRLCRAVMVGDDQRDRDNGLVTAAALAALRDASWPGRGQVVEYQHQHHLTDGISSRNDDALITRRMRFFLDGAHTVQSVRAAMEWFQFQYGAVQQPTNKKRNLPIMFFACSHERNPVELLEELLLVQRTDTALFSRVYFVTTDTARPSSVALPTAEQLLFQSSRTAGSNNSKTTATATWPETLQALWTHLEGEKQRPRATTRANVTVAEALNDLVQEEEEDETTLDVFATGSLYLVGSVLKAVDWTEEDYGGDHGGGE